METITVGQTVTVQGQTEWASLNGATGKVMMIFAETNAYSGDRVALYEVLVNGRHHRLQRHEIAA